MPSSGDRSGKIVSGPEEPDGAGTDEAFKGVADELLAISKPRTEPLRGRDSATKDPDGTNEEIQPRVQWDFSKLLDDEYERDLAGRWQALREASGDLTDDDNLDQAEYYLACVLRDHQEHFSVLCDLAFEFFERLTALGGQKILADLAGCLELNQYQRDENSKVEYFLPLEALSTRPSSIAELAGNHPTRCVGARLLWWCAAIRDPSSFGYKGIPLVERLMQTPVWTRMVLVRQPPEGVISHVITSHHGSAEATGLGGIVMRAIQADPTPIRAMQEAVKRVCDILDDSRTAGEGSDNEEQHQTELSSGQAGGGDRSPSERPRQRRSSLDRWAVGLDGRVWWAFKRVGSQWHQKGKVEVAVGNDSDLLLALATGGGYISKIDAIKVFNDKPSDMDAAKIFTSTVKPAFSRIRQQLRKSMALGKADPIPFSKRDPKGYRAVIEVGFVHKHDVTGRLEFRRQEEQDL